MAGKSYNTRVKNKRDSSSNWTSNNPVILNGEIILVDTAEGELRAKIGDGVKTYTQLPFSDEALRALIEEKTMVDDALSSTSTRPVQNKVVNASISNLNELVGDVPVAEQITTALIDNQSDWNQDDEAATGYIKNRTHYTIDYTLVDNFTFEGTNGWIDIEDDYFYADRVYNVTFDGVSYECVPYFCDWQGFLAIGNQLQTGKTGIEDNGMNFYATLYNYTLDVYAKLSSNDTHTITITSTKAKTIDPIYLEGGMTKGTAAYSEVFNGMPKEDASGVYSHAEGEWAIANGDGSHAEGGWTIADGFYSHVEGDMSVAYGSGAHAEGYITAAIGRGAHSEGQGWYKDIEITGDANSTTYTVVSGQEDVHVGCTIKNQNIVAVITGYDSDTSTITVDKTLSKATSLNETMVRLVIDGISNGDGSHVEGAHNIVSGNASHVGGSYNVANYANVHISGAYNKYDAELVYGIKEEEVSSSYITSSSVYSFEYEFDKQSGCFTLIDPISASTTFPAGSYVIKSSSVNGEVTEIRKVIESNGDGTYHVIYLKRASASQCKGDYIHIVGNGTSDTARSNAHTLDWSGNAWFAGDVKIGGTDYDDPNAQILATVAMLQSMLPKVTTITLGTTWSGTASPYYQDVALSCVTGTSMVTLQPTGEQLASWQDEGLAFTTLSSDGSVRIYCAGGTPTESISVQVTVQEVVEV